MQGFFYHGGGRFAGNALRLPHGKGHGRKEIIPQGADRFIGFIGDDGRLDALRLKALKKAKNAIIWFCGDVAVILVVGLELIENGLEFFLFDALWQGQTAEANCSVS